MADRAELLTRILLAAALLTLGAGAAAAQDSTQARRKPRPADSTRVTDTTVAGDGTQRARERPQSADERYAEIEARTKVQLPVLPRLADAGPEPTFARTVFDRDSIEWVNAATVGDLVARIPGAFIWRGGRRGRPEPANFQGRGSTSVQYLLDGMPYVAMGPDSLAVDPSLFPLNFLDRVEVERWPGRLEVRLYTRRHDRLAPRSRIAAGTGSDGLATYGGEIEQRFRSGFGVVASGDYVRAPASGGGVGNFTSNGLWVQGSYVPSATFGLQYQLVRTSTDRDAFSAALGGTGERQEGKRTDAQLRASFGKQADGSGPRLDLVYARSGWDSAGITQQVNQLGGVASIRAAAFTGGVSAFRRGAWTSFDSRAWLGWSPTALLTASGEAVFQHHFGGRTTRWAGARASLTLPLGLSIGGAVRAGSEVAAPSIITDTAQLLRDVQLSAALERGWIGAEATYSRGNAYQPFAYQPYPGIATISAHGRTEWLTVAGHLAPWRWLVLDGWLSNPRAPVEGQPPRHYMANGTIRSKFLREFPSGYFELKLQLGVEGWSAGSLGVDPAGGPVLLPAGNFLRSLVQMEIGRLTFYWDARNITGSTHVYVPGFEMPSYSNAFGIRWEFLN